jgi:hypothetical protein
VNSPRAPSNACAIGANNPVRSQCENNGGKIYSRDDYTSLKVFMTDNDVAKDNVPVGSWQILLLIACDFQENAENFKFFDDSA